ncbi:hypothetical protein CERSUDRAFT_93117 [Gelatoporia subvermispora B]|uniref:F-box domain-containing protein n=1 Tax=Ceriporiopsis subvermispora (strain B) TaxID=914234 RepID=M2PR63_CERS8|nr:hypothetical protein CERSUDRAFT_93117 [Gelatoporia subvermispora B]
MSQVVQSITPAEQSPVSWPWLPVELVEDIIAKAWSSSLTSDERIDIFTSLCLVNHTFLRLFIRIALRDVHIPSPAFASHYLRLLRERTPSEPDSDYFLENASSTANELCRTLIFHIDGRDPAFAPSSVRLFSARDPAAGAVGSTLYMLDILRLCPNLRRVALAYADWSFDDIFDHARLLLVPPQATDLEVRFAFSPGAPARVAHALRQRYARRGRAYWTTPNVRRLEIFGASTEFVSDMLETCPNAEVLETDSVEKLDMLAQSPSNLHTLGLHLPNSRIHEEDVKAWRLRESLDAGLLSAATAPNVVMFAGHQEPAVLEHVNQICTASQTRLHHVVSF